MSIRTKIIEQAFTRFESRLRLGRWAFIDEALADAGQPELDSRERDAVDLGAAMGIMPELPVDGDNAAADAGETVGATSEDL